jgi:hypothetical protein
MRQLEHICVDGNSGSVSSLRNEAVTPEGISMAQKTITQYFDDLDGSPLEESNTIAFSLGRKSYEIDLSTENLAKLEEAMAPFIQAARPAGNAPAGRSSSARKPSDRDLADVRAWAAQNGHTVSERGRVPAAVLQAYDAAH